MSLEYLLDTNAISAPLAKQPNAKLVRRLKERMGRCAIAAPIWQELIYGCRLLPAGKRRTDLEDYLEQVVRATLTILPYDEAAAAWHGEERARLKRLGKMPPAVDGEIAAIAVSQSLILVTANVRDFAPFTHLKVEDWSA